MNDRHIAAAILVVLFGFLSAAICAVTVLIFAFAQLARLVVG